MESFIDRFVVVVERARAVLAPQRYLAVVIGISITRANGSRWGFALMQVVMDQGCTLKSIVVKNLDCTWPNANSRHSGATVRSRAASMRVPSTSTSSCSRRHRICELFFTLESDLPD